ncbi:MAG: glycosyltransferase family 2 protein [Oscillospiraceae bacterium]|nr:glycosyltransferase family 2 protein [Oscillospiraceae bacterium]
MVCAGIVLFNPDIERLAQNIGAIESQVEKLVFVDNASDNIDEMQVRFNDEKYVWIKNDANVGIAAALNQLIGFADENDYKWILTLDQDSICGDDLVQKLLVAADEESDVSNKLNALGRITTDVVERVAMVAPLVNDRGNLEAEMSSDAVQAEIEDVRMCITSGCLTNVRSVIDIGGFNEWLFIDEVDREICLRLLLQGYRLLRVNTVQLCHEFGLKTVNRKFLWKDVTYHNYTPFRIFYQIRNIVYMMRKYKRDYTPSIFRRWIRMFATFSVKFIFERDRMERLKAFIKGIYAGLTADITSL